MSAPCALGIYRHIDSARYLNRDGNSRSGEFFQRKLKLQNLTVGRESNCMVKTTNVPLGPVRRNVRIKKTGMAGKCVGLFWPLSGRPDEMSVTVKMPTDAIQVLPLNSVES